MTIDQNTPLTKFETAINGLDSLKLPNYELEDEVLNWDYSLKNSPFKPASTIEVEIEYCDSNEPLPFDDPWGNDDFEEPTHGYPGYWNDNYLNEEMEQ